MVDLQEGEICIDGIDIARLRASDVRSRLNFVPDEPFFLPGSIRANLDPHGCATDHQLQEALSAIASKGVLKDPDLNADLNPADLSHGEKQLFALVRAMLHPQKQIVILDEATSR
jgi:ABC-type multidrug transport system fused ATPase/permease subunit